MVERHSTDESVASLAVEQALACRAEAEGGARITKTKAHLILVSVILVVPKDFVVLTSGTGKGVRLRKSICPRWTGLKGIRAQSSLVMKRVQVGTIAIVCAIVGLEAIPLALHESVASSFLQRKWKQ